MSTKRCLPDLLVCMIALAFGQNRANVDLTTLGQCSSVDVGPRLAQQQRFCTIITSAFERNSCVGPMLVKTMDSRSLNVHDHVFSFQMDFFVVVDREYCQLVGGFISSEPTRVYAVMN